jgi:hypothetical protein
LCLRRGREIGLVPGRQIRPHPIFRKFRGLARLSRLPAMRKARGDPESRARYRGHGRKSACARARHCRFCSSPRPRMA